jgi:hypoxanthine phosphoribosyltransferase
MTPPTQGSPETFGDLQKILITRQQIARRVDELAENLTELYRDEELTILVVLTGALIFVADLVRKMPLKVLIEPVSVSSYPGLATRSREPKFRLPLPDGLAGRNVLIVDDIFDSGQTMAILTEAGYVKGAEHVRTCALLKKDRPDLPVRGEVDLHGFDIPDEFVVGYGLDFDGHYRNLPDIGVLDPHARGGA